MSWDGQNGGRRPHAPLNSRRNSRLQSQLVDSIKQSWLRYDASPASTWLQASIVNLATGQKPRGCSTSGKMAKLFLILVELATFLVAFFVWASPRRRTQPWLIRETCWKVVWTLIRGMILRINLPQYSQNSVTANSSLPSPTEGVNTILPRLRETSEMNCRKWSWEYSEMNYGITTTKIGTTRTTTQAAQHARQVHQWRRWHNALPPRWTRGVHALSLHALRIFHSVHDHTAHLIGSSPESISQSSLFHPWRTLLDSLLRFLLLPLPPVCLRLSLTPRAVP